MSRSLALLAFVLSGCAVNDEYTATDEQTLLSPNGTSADGVASNLLSPNGGSTGARLTGVLPTGTARDGTKIKISSTGAPLTGDLVGSTWIANVNTGSIVVLRIDEAQRGTGNNSELWSYRVSASFDGTWHPLCSELAISVRGTWNLAEGVTGGGAYHPETPEFTIACRGAAIPKCVEMGFKPWTGHTQDLAACVRALRADFCGDGTPYTVDGTLINLYDRSGVLSDGQAWRPEAEWTADGAACVSSAANTRFSQVAHVTPWCFSTTLKPKISCGSAFSTGSLIITELPPL